MSSKKKNILFIDDEEIQHDIVGGILKDRYNFFTAKSGKEALDYLLKKESTPHLILLDILMPDMDGWEVFSRLKAISLLKNVPIIFLTAVHGQEYEKKALEMGAVGFISKPYDEESLIKSIEKNIKN